MAFNLTLPIAIGADHAGFECKEKLISIFKALFKKIASAVFDNF